MERQDRTAAFTGLVDLAAERVGGKALIASDEFFAGKENLLKPGRGIFIPDKYTDRGKWMDGWESRRKRTPGCDWCVVELGLPGLIKGVDIDTDHFLGNNPSYASIEAASFDGKVSIDKLSSGRTVWSEILGKSPIMPAAQNFFSVASSQRWTHIRLNIYPDGGIARLRIYGEVVPDWTRMKKNVHIDLAAISNGGLVVAASDMFFGSKENLIMPGRARNMGGGWETRRRRGSGFDWAIVKLGRPGEIRKIEVDTSHFKGNYPDQCSVEVCNESEKNIDALTCSDVEWREILARVNLKPDKRHFFEKELKKIGTCTHVRLNIYPDGGVSRLRVWGVIG